MPIANVGDAMREMKGGSKHIRTRAQAIAVGLKAEGKARPRSKRRGRRASKGRSLSSRSGRY